MRADQNKTKRQLAAHVEYTSVVSCLGGKKNPRGVREVFGIFRSVSRCLFIIIPRFRAESMKIFCGFLVGKHWTSPLAGWLKNRASTPSRERDMSLPHNTRTTYDIPLPSLCTPAFIRGVKRQYVKLLPTYIQHRLVTSSWRDVWLSTRTTSNLIWAQQTTLCISCLNWSTRYEADGVTPEPSIKFSPLPQSGCCGGSSFYWASVANAPNVLQPYWIILLPLDVPDLTASLLLWGPSGQRWRYLWTFLFSNVPTFVTSRLQEILAAKDGITWARNGRWVSPENARLPRNIQGCSTCRKSTTWDRQLYLPSEGRHAEDFFRP